MTKQLPNEMIYEGEKYYISAISINPDLTVLYKPHLKDSDTLTKTTNLKEEERIKILRKNMLKSFPCNRLNVQTYRILKKELLLDTMMVISITEPIQINGREPEKLENNTTFSDKIFDYIYKNLHLKTRFTGKLLIRHEKFSDKILIVKDDRVLSILDESDRKFAELEEEKIWINYMDLYIRKWK